MAEDRVFYVAECVICLDQPTDIIFSPCYHQCCCSDCTKEIQLKNMDCPMCRSDIAETLEASGPQDLIDDDLLATWIERRDSYMKTLRGKVSRNAGFLGKTKLAKQTANIMGDELSDVILSNAGTARMSAADTKVVVDEKNIMTITYTPYMKKKAIVEKYLFGPIEDEIDADKRTLLELASHEPRLYYLLHYLHGGDVEKGMEERGILQKRRRRSNK